MRKLLEIDDNYYNVDSIVKVTWLSVPAVPDKPYFTINFTTGENIHIDDFAGYKRQKLIDFIIDDNLSKIILNLDK